MPHLCLRILRLFAIPLMPRLLLGARRGFAIRYTGSFILALIVVFMVLAAQFESLVHPFTILLAVPLAVTGALLLLYFTGSTLNLYSQIGMVLLIGIVTKNSILLVEYANQLKARGLLLRKGPENPPLWG